MLFPIGSTATHCDQAWQVTGVRAHTREPTSLDGQRTIYAAVDRLTEAP